MQNTSTHLPSLLGAILFAMSGLFLLGVSFLMGSAALYRGVACGPIQAQQTIFFLAFGFEAILLFTIAFFTFQKTLQNPAADLSTSVSVSAGQILLWIFLAVSAILVGSWAGRREPFNWLLLPVLTIPAVALPLGALVALATHRLPLGTRWQSWSTLGLGMTLAPFLLLVLETILAIVLLIGVIAYITTQPGLSNELQGIARQLLTLRPDSEAAQDLLLPWLTRPGVIVIALLYIAVLVPAIEELCKPLGVWLLAGKLNSRAQGFTLGALSGAGYALIETIGVSGQVAEWGILLFTRIGTGLLHITTTALMGAAIVQAWCENRSMGFLRTYLGAVVLHGLWNALAMLFTFSTLAVFLEQSGPLGRIQPWIIASMSLLAAGLLFILIRSNRRVGATAVQPASELAKTIDPANRVS